MSDAVSYCPNCGSLLDANNSCPQCDLSYSAVVSEQPKSKPSGFDLAWAIVVWGISGGFLLMLDLAYRIWLNLRQGGIPEIRITTPIVIFSLLVTMLMQLAGLAAAWLVVTKAGRRPFWRTLKWGSHPRFKWFHAVVLAFLMFGVGILAEKILPHKETELEKFLKLGLAVRLMVVALAVLTAPLIEE